MSESQLIEYKESWRDEYPNEQYILQSRLYRKLGGGIEKICNLCKEYGIAEPEYTVHPNDIMMMFKANGTVTDTVNDTVKTILALIEQNPSITYEEMTEKTGKSRRTISRLITELKERNIIARVGSDKTGHWEIVKQ